MAGEAPVNVIAGQFGPKSGEALLVGQGIPIEAQMPPGVMTELKKGLESQSKDPTAWKETLFRVREKLTYQTGNFTRAEAKLLHKSLGKELQQLEADGLITADVGTDAKERYEKIEKANAIFSDVDKGFKSQTEDRQTEIVEFLTPYYKRTPLGEALAASGVPEETLQQNVRDLLNKGLHPEDRRAMQEAYKQWIEEANKDLDPLQEQVKTTKEGIKNLEEKIRESEKKRKSLKKEISDNETEYEDYKDGKKYDVDIRTLRTNDGANKAIISRYPTEITALDLELQNLTRLEAEILQARGDTNAIAQAYNRARYGGGQLAVDLQQIASDQKQFDLEHIRSRIETVKSDQTNLNTKYNKAAKDHERLGELEGRRNKLETTIKKDKEDRKLEEDRQIEWKEQRDKEKQHVADLVKQFQLFETGLTDMLYEQTMEDIMQRYVARHGTIALGKIENAMSAISEQNKLKIRQYANRKFLDIEGAPWERIRKGAGKIVGKTFGYELDTIFGTDLDQTSGRIQKWIENRVGGRTLTVRWKESEIEQFYHDKILNPGNTFQNIDPWIQAALGSETRPGNPMTAAEWNRISPEEKMQLRSMVVLEHISMRYNATGEMPTLLEQRILVSQPWSNELIKAGVIGNPEFVDQMKTSVPDVTPEALKNNDPAAIGKVRDAAMKDRMMGLVLLGLSAASATSAITKEEKPEQA
ncbi:MAG: hypothetical protein UW22_C0042G0007 [Candidatus Gottesmanbacteria bacterium GW2011_GWB1_44_11c]|uniref:Uncharacterized protein n=1 Tax=Candidatus Gottesmanbacteria bacterium GW2011_GWB1_44_11c TaxID=1618447 RepID=A0A0G1GNV4_9BACT|nr:MAG: hypothetical protein UW22_C0042G0007 [Candidatus Gottesmanbacteria bacterium GW2011_GWB1_44_11c]HCM82007.1 hypothetical protein [Patescibacteria group bacterium]